MRKALMLVSAILIVLVAIVTTVGATPPQFVSLCNPAGHPVNVPANANIDQLLESGWTFPPCTPVDEDPEECPEGSSLVDGVCVPDEDPGDEDPVCEEGETLIDGVCVPDEPGGEDPGDEDPVDETPDGGNTASTPAPAPATCVDIFAPFLANVDLGAARAFLFNADGTLGAQLLIVPADHNPADRDTVRAGNDAGILCVGVLNAGEQVVAFVTPDGTVAGLVEVQEIGNSIVIHRAIILRWDILTIDPLWGGTWDWDTANWQ